MNTPVYLLILIMGIITLVISSHRIARLKKTIRAIDNKPLIIKKSHSGSLDLQSIVIANSPWLSMLQRLDQNPASKLKILASIGAVVLLINMLGITSFTIKDIAMQMVLLLIVIIVTPALLQKPALSTRRKLMTDAIPYLIDLLAVCVQAGMTVEHAIKFVARHSDNIDPNLTSLMEQLTKHAEVSGLEEALMDLYRSVDLTEMRMFCSSLQQSVHYGTSLYDNLIELSRDMREMQLLRSEEQIGKLSARMSVPLILFIMFPIIVLIAAPGILRIFKDAVF
ncbi:type II secretion system F family protein [Erwinia tasmaniensis]|uniref:type II secretion system F family protein n=1 Tax=Erwinia tasmaniensis TaxID=338565 RepID=UPI003A4E5786